MVKHTADQPTDTAAKTHRCKATKGDEQCQRTKHSEMTGHTWGVQGETDQWRTDGTPKTDRDRWVEQLKNDTPTEEIRAVGAFDPGVEPTVTATAPAALVPADPRANGDAFDKLSAQALHALTQLTEAKRFADVHHYETDTLIELLTLSVESATQVYERRLVGPDVIDKGRLLFDSWMIRRGLRKVEGGGS